MDKLQLRKKDILPGWSSHLPVLIKAVQHTVEPVLELGAGLFSTPVLHWLCEKQKRKLITLESDPKFYSFISVFSSKTHEVRFVEDWDKEDLDRKWGVALIDHLRGRRAIDALRLRDNTEYIILHDTEKRHYEKFRYNAAFWTNFNYVYHWKFADPSTTIVSNKSDLKIFYDKRTSLLHQQ